jgi:hypothetical protein
VICGICGVALAIYDPDYWTVYTLPACLMSLVIIGVVVWAAISTFRQMKK